MTLYSSTLGEGRGQGLAPRAMLSLQRCFLEVCNTAGLIRHRSQRRLQRRVLISYLT